MAPTLVNLAFGLLIGAAFLGAAYDRRSVLIVAAAATVSDVDAVASLYVEGATNALFHTLFVPAVGVAVLYWDTTLREESWIVERYGWWGVRVGWVALAAYVVAGIGVDLFDGSGVNLFYPIVDRFYAIDGRLLVSTQDGVIQTYVGLGNGVVSVDTLGSTADHHVASWVNPTPGPSATGEADRRLRLVDSEMHLVAVAAAVAVTAIRLRGVR